MAFSPLLPLAIAATSHSGQTSLLSSRLSCVWLLFPWECPISSLATTSAATISLTDVRAAAPTGLTAYLRPAARIGLLPPALFHQVVPSSFPPFGATIAGYFFSFLSGLFPLSPPSSGALPGLTFSPSSCKGFTTHLGDPSLLPLYASVPVPFLPRFRFRALAPMMPAASRIGTAGSLFSVISSSGSPATYATGGGRVLYAWSNSFTSNSSTRQGNRTHRTSIRRNPYQGLHYKREREDQVCSSAGKADGCVLSIRGNTSQETNLRLNEEGETLRSKERSKTLDTRVPAPSLRKGHSAALLGKCGANTLRTTRRDRHPQQQCACAGRLEQTCVALFPAAAVCRLRNRAAPVNRQVRYLTSTQQQQQALLSLQQALLSLQQALLLQKQEQHAVQRSQERRAVQDDQQRLQVQMPAKPRVISVKGRRLSSCFPCAACPASLPYSISLLRRAPTNVAGKSGAIAPTSLSGGAPPDAGAGAAASTSPSGGALLGVSASPAAFTCPSGRAPPDVGAAACAFLNGRCGSSIGPRHDRASLWASGIPAAISLTQQQLVASSPLSGWLCAAFRRYNVHTLPSVFRYVRVAAPSGRSGCSDFRYISLGACSGRGGCNDSEQSSRAPHIRVHVPSCWRSPCPRRAADNGSAAAAAAAAAAPAVVTFPAPLAFAGAAAPAVDTAAARPYCRPICRHLSMWGYCRPTYTRLSMYTLQWPLSGRDLALLLASCCDRFCFEVQSQRHVYVSSLGNTSEAKGNNPYIVRCASGASGGFRGEKTLLSACTLAYSGLPPLLSAASGLPQHCLFLRPSGGAAVAAGVLSTNLPAAASACGILRGFMGSCLSSGGCGAQAAASLRPAAAALGGLTDCVLSAAAAAAAGGAHALVPGSRGAAVYAPIVSAVYAPIASAASLVAPEAAAVSSLSSLSSPCSRKREEMRRVQMQRRKREQLPLQRERPSWSLPGKVKQKEEKLSMRERADDLEGESTDRGTSTPFFSVSPVDGREAKANARLAAKAAAGAARWKRASSDTALAASAASSRGLFEMNGTLRKMQREGGREAAAPSSFSSPSPTALLPSAAAAAVRTKVRRNCSSPSTTALLPSAAAAAVRTRVRHSCSSSSGAESGYRATARLLPRLQQKQLETQATSQATGRLPQQEFPLGENNRHLQQEAASAQRQRQQESCAGQQELVLVPLCAQEQQPAGVPPQQPQKAEAARLWLDVNTLAESVEGAAGRRVEAAHEGATESRTTQPSIEQQDKGGPWYLRLMSFNVLADSLTDYKYRALDQNIVRWANREKAIRAEILRHRPAVGCLQEVDRHYYWRCFKGFLSNSGYESFYKQKTNGREDGLATFWLKDRFEVLERQELEFSLSPNQRLGAEPQVGLLLLLRERTSSEYAARSGSGRREGGSEASDGICIANYSGIDNFSDSTAGIKSTGLGLRPVHLENATEDNVPAKAAEGGQTCRGGEARRGGASASSLDAGGCKVSCFPDSDSQAPLAPVATRLEKGGVADSTSSVNMSTVGRLLIVANTHLLFNSKRGDIKLSQLLQLVGGVQEMHEHAICRVKNELRSLLFSKDGKSAATNHASSTHPYSSIPLAGLAATNGATQPSEAAQSTAEGATQEKLLSAAAERLVDVVLCGDFNFTPHSPLYQLLLQGCFDFRGLDRRKLSGQFLMERRVYRVDAEGYHGRGATVVSSPAESHQLSASDLGTPTGLSCGAGSPPKHSWSMPAAVNAAAVRSEQHSTSPRQPQQRAEDTPQSSQQSPPLYSCTAFSSSSAVAGDTYSTVSPQWLRETGDFCVSGGRSAGESVTVQPVQATVKSATSPRLQAATSSGTSVEDDGLPLSPERRTPAPPSLIRLPFQFRSAYALPRKPRGGAAVRGGRHSRQDVMEEPAFTAYHGWQKGCIDYVFYSSKDLEVGHLYQFPPLSNAAQYGCCPNELWPCSDHYSLVVDLVKGK